VAERCVSRGCRCMVVDKGLCRTCLAKLVWDRLEVTPDDGLPEALGWLDLDRLETTVPGRDWMDRAACAGQTAAFFGERGDSTREARALCAVCPVVYECLRWVLDHQSTAVDHGIWGDTSVRQRRSIRRALDKRANIRELMDRAS